MDARRIGALPRRLEDHFKLRFAQETSPPVDPIRDEWVFDSSVFLGDRGGLWSDSDGALYSFDSRILSTDQLEWLKRQRGVKSVSFTRLLPSKTILSSTGASCT